MTGTLVRPAMWDGGPIQIAPSGLPREEWLRVRRQGLGGSDVGAILGLDDYASPLTVYMDKRGELDYDTAGEAAEWGNLLEPVVASKWAEIAGVQIWAPGVLVHPNRPWQLANPDRFFTGEGVHPGLVERPDGVLEVKTSNQYKSQDWDPDADRMPDRARLQVQHYLDVTGLRDAQLAALIGGQQLRIFHETYDPELAEMLRAEASRFWHDHVLAGNPPPVDGNPATTELLGRLWEVNPETDVVVLDPTEVRALVIARNAAKEAVKAAEIHAASIDNQLKQLLGPAQIGVVDGKPVVTWKEQTRSSYVAKESTFRVLRIPSKALDHL